MSYGWRESDLGRLEEFCDECGFDSCNVDLRDRLEKVLSDLTALCASPHFRSSPRAGVWSAEGYVAHCLEMVGETVSVVHEGRPEPRADVPDLPAAIDHVTRLVDAQDEASWHREIVLGGPFPATPWWMLHHLLHDLEHHRLDIRRGYASLALAAGNGPTVER